MELNFLNVTILGVLEGLTEFIPISSTGHLVLMSRWLGLEGRAINSFEIFIQLGAILAVVFYYPDRFRQLFRSFISFRQEGFSRSFNVLHLIICMLPAVLMGLLFYELIKTHLFTPRTVALALIVGGVFFIIEKKIITKPPTADNLDKITYRQALYVGLAQCLSLWPGMSRSGSTIAGGLLAGLNYQTAAQFSFIVAVPIMVMAIAYDLLKSYSYIEASMTSYFLLGCLISFVVAFLSIGWFMRLLNRFKLVPFGWYRIGLGILVLVLVK